MKRIILCLLLAVSGSVCGFAQQTDPTLTAAVATQTEILKKIFKTRDKTQKEIIATEVAVTAAMERMHQLEKKMLEYLQNAQGAMQNIYQIKRAAELVAVEIPNNMSLLRKSLPGHLKGTAIALMVSDELADATTQMITLNSAERYYIANEVVTRLETINTDLWLLAWQIRTLSWNDLWFGLDPEGWATVMSGKYIVEGLIWEWNYL